MSEPEESRPLQLYADAYGGPDLETTSRARHRVREYVMDRRTRKQRWSHRAQGGLGLLLLLAAGYGAWAALGGGQVPHDSRVNAAPSIVTQKQPQTVELARGGTLMVAPQSRIEMLDDGEPGSLVEVVDGEIEADLVGADAAARFRAGAYEVRATDARFTMRRRDGAPSVTVARGSVTLNGPDLPDAGVQITAPE